MRPSGRSLLMLVCAGGICLEGALGFLCRDGRACSCTVGCVCRARRQEPNVPPALQAPVLLGSLEVAHRHSMSEMAVKCGIPRVPGRNPESAQSEMIWNVGFVGRPAWGPAVVVPQNL